MLNVLRLYITQSWVLLSIWYTHVRETRYHKLVQKGFKVLHHLLPKRQLKFYPLNGKSIRGYRCKNHTSLREWWLIVLAFDSSYVLSLVLNFHLLPCMERMAMFWPPPRWSYPSLKRNTWFQCSLLELNTRPSGLAASHPLSMSIHTLDLTTVHPNMSQINITSDIIILNPPP